MSAAEEFNARVLEDPRAATEQAESLSEAFRSGGVLFAGVPMATFLRPHFLDRADWTTLRASSTRLLELAARLARSVFGGDTKRLCDFLGTPEREARIVTLDPGEPDVVISRLDAFGAQKGPRFVEINSDAPAGFGYGDRMAAIFADLPLFRDFARGRAVRYIPSGPRLVEAVVNAFAGQGRTGTPRVAILDWSDVKTRADQEILRDLFEAKGYPCVLVDPRELAVEGGRLLSPQGAIDLVYRRVVLSELVEREDEVKPFLEAYRKGLAVFVNSFRCRLSEDKAFLAILTDETFDPFLRPGERAFLDSVVPWTRRIDERRTRRAGASIDLIPHVLAHKDELVLKPAHGYGGASVVVGDEAGLAEWERAVLQGLETSVVVQERVAIPEELFPVVESGAIRLEGRKVNVNPFYVAGADVGAVARASQSTVINVSAGGGSVPIFVVG
jgi:uncharacterized circularly permuted ATP-grasp superfamily protein